MNQNNPSINQAVVDQHIEKRRTAAENYRKARLATGEVRSPMVRAWREAFGHGLITLGERVSAHKPTGLPTG